MSYVYAIAAIVTGLAVTVYNFSGATDPYWSRKTRVVSGVAAMVGLGCTLLGMWAMTL